MAKASYTNTSTGARGGYLSGVLVMVEPGQTAELDDAPEEWFEKAGAKATKAVKEEAAADAKDETKS